MPPKRLLITSFWLVCGFANTSLTAGFVLPFVQQPAWQLVSVLWMIAAAPVLFKALKAAALAEFLIGFLILSGLAISMLSPFDPPVNPFKIVFFSFASIVVVHLFRRLSTRDMLQTASELWAVFFLYLSGFVITNLLLKNGAFAGANQHQFYLTGLAAFVAVMIISIPLSERFSIRVLPLTMAVASVVAIFLFTKSRQMLPFSLAVVALSSLPLLPKLSIPLGGKFLPVLQALILVGGLALPLLHLSGAFGSFLNVGSNVFGKTRAVETISERERAFQRWLDRALGQPELVRFGSDLPFVGVIDDDGNETGKPSVTSSHNLYLDWIVRFGFVYAIFSAVLFLTCYHFAVRGNAGYGITYQLAVAVLFGAWLFSANFDDEHWFYHIPFITLPLLVLATGRVDFKMRAKADP